MNPGLEDLQARLGYTFRDPSLLAEALTHPSYLQERPDLVANNQRLEFLGDAVLHMILTDALYALFPVEREGALTRRRAALTRGSVLSDFGRRFQLHLHLRMSAGEESTGGRSRAAALEDALEAVVGAIYRDSDLTATRSVVLGWYGDLRERLALTEDAENPKGRLQELVQPLHGNDALRYDVLTVEGKDHERSYEVAVYLKNDVIGRGRGSSKKLAEEEAAREALKFNPNSQR